jgi:DNA modification methylase
MKEKINGDDVTWVRLDTLVPWSRNARQHDTDSTSKLAAGIRRFGFPVPITAWQSERRIAAGHGRRLAMQALLAEDPGFVPRNAPPGTPPGFVPVMWTEFASEQQFEAFALSDNRQAKNAQDDDLLIAAVLRDLDSQGIDFDGMGFDESEIDDLIGALEAEANAVEGSEADDDVPDLQEDCDSKPGEVYQLGPHRLVCGDSTEPASWDLLLEGEAADLVWTDPPYGLAVVGGFREDLSRDGLTIQNDSLSADDLETLLRKAFGLLIERSAAGAPVYVASPSGPLMCAFWNSLGPSGLGLVRHELIWVKSSAVFNMNLDFPYRHEAILYGWTKGAHRRLTGPGRSTVFEHARPHSNKDHPSMKPVSLIVDMLGRFRRAGAVVVDPFGGSGSTLIAAARLGQRARLIELDPAYCDVIRRRWTQWATEHNIDPGAGALAAESQE